MVCHGVRIMAIPSNTGHFAALSLFLKAVIVEKATQAPQDNLEEKAKKTADLGSHKWFLGSDINLGEGSI